MVGYGEQIKESIFLCNFVFNFFSIEKCFILFETKLSFMMASFGQLPSLHDVIVRIE